MKEKLHEVYPLLYGNTYRQNEMDERYRALIERHGILFGKDSPMIFSAAGRTEIAGNHTDHNLGKVIGATISLDIIAAVSLRDDERVILASEGFPVSDVDISDTEVRESEGNTTASLIRGIADAFRKKGIEIHGWEANTSSSVPKGSGLSSSAAVEVLCAEIFSSLYADDSLSSIDLAKAGQYAENAYFGKPSGLLDQICSASGGMTYIDFKKLPETVPLSFDFSESGHRMIITDTKGSHADLGDDYRSIPEEMKAVAAFYGKSCLRDVSFSSFLDDIPAIRKAIKNDRALLRAYHFFTENIRADKMRDALCCRRFDEFLRLVRESGDSSFRFLQNIYSQKDPGLQALSLGIAASESILKGAGAVRVHGGGFAGTIQAYVPEEKTGTYIEGMERIFGKGCSTEIGIRSLPAARIL